MPEIKNPSPAMVITASLIPLSKSSRINTIPTKEYIAKLLISVKCCRNFFIIALTFDMSGTQRRHRLWRSGTLGPAVVCPFDGRVRRHCGRVARGGDIKNITVKESPDWLKQRLKAIGLRPINNIVDITNYILHETGQPLHAFDADAITGAEVIVKNLPEGTAFITLDEKERKLNADDLMICNKEEAMCIAGVFGGQKSGVTVTSKNIFLESAWFNPVTTRKTSFRHNLRTDAAARFEKGVDISNTVHVLKRAALLIKELAGGEIASDVVDVYPTPKEKTQIVIKYHFLKKISGKNYHPDTVKKIFESLNFEILKDSIDELWVAAPLSKPDIELPADLAEEIMRIDGLDNVEIPTSITISPSTEVDYTGFAYKEKISNSLAGQGFYEIFTNSIANSAWYSEEVLSATVKMLNNLSAELNVMRPSMLETGLQCIAFNLNRRNNNLRLFEFGKTYTTSAVGKYFETDHLAIYTSGNNESSWKQKAAATDVYFLKTVVSGILQQAGLLAETVVAKAEKAFSGLIQYKIKKQIVARIGIVDTNQLKLFDIKQPVYFADINWNILTQLASKAKLEFKEIPRFPSVERDLALVIAQATTYAEVEETILNAKVSRLKSVSLFDVFESEKIGKDKKSMALNFIFQDDEKTLTDNETEQMMGTLIHALEKQLAAEIRK